MGHFCFFSIFWVFSAHVYWCCIQISFDFFIHFFLSICRSFTSPPPHTHKHRWLFTYTCGCGQGLGWGEMGSLASAALRVHNVKCDWHVGLARVLVSHSYRRSWSPGSDARTGETQRPFNHTAQTPAQWSDWISILQTRLRPPKQTKWREIGRGCRENYFQQHTSVFFFSGHQETLIYRSEKCAKRLSWFHDIELWLLGNTEGDKKDFLKHLQDFAKHGVNGSYGY